MTRFQDIIIFCNLSILLVTINNGKVASKKYLLVRMQSQDGSGNEGQKTRNLLLSFDFLSRNEIKFYHIFNDNFTLLLIAECRTINGPEADKLCIFPFNYNGKEYYECTTEGYEDSYWCGTTYSVTDHAGWGFCSGPCKPLKRRNVLKSVLNRTLKNGNVGFRKSPAGRIQIT